MFFICLNVDKFLVFINDFIKRDYSSVSGGEVWVKEYVSYGRYYINNGS